MHTENTADNLLSFADDLFQLNKIEEALQAYTDTYDLARKEFNRSIEVEALSQMARMQLKLKDAQKGLELLKDAEDRATESDPLGWSRYLSVKGRFEWLSDSLEPARETFNSMFEFCQTNQLWTRSVDAANMMAIVSEHTEEQIEWSKRGIEAAEATDNERLLGPLWNNLAGTYYDNKDFENALECYKKSREYHWRFSGENAKLFADYHIGMTYRLLKQFDEAKAWLRPVLAWAERMGNDSAIGQASEDLGEIEQFEGNKETALSYFKHAREAYQKAGFDETWPEVWENIIKRIRDVEG
ncbi:MAG: tetratricopeptide repeat protein [Calditrichaeota bacterium]|nr:MAG: tetratricopeptide repeat protein [Calditrichota bacterium]